jgi:hypothetical protein
MMALLAIAAVLEGTEAIPTSPGIHFEKTALCSLARPAVTTTFRNLEHLPTTPRFVLVLSKAARDFGIDDQSLLLIQRRLGGIVLLEVPITVTAIEGREDAYRVVPDRELWLDDYSFAVKKDAAITFFGCSFTTLP